MPLNLTAHFSKQSRQTVPHINRTIFKASVKSTSSYITSLSLFRTSHFQRPPSNSITPDLQEPETGKRLPKA